MLRTVRYTLAAALVVTASIASSSSAAVLYDGALGTSPVDQGMIYGSNPAGTYYATAAGATTLDTTSSSSISAGFTGAAGTLDRVAGYMVRVDARVLSSTFTNSSRAGFSLIALSSDKRGIEIGFHADEVFAQGDSPLFVRVESAAFDTTAAVRRYELNVFGNAYTLTADGASILSGPLRDYSDFPIIYNTPNFLFIGDNSTSAAGSTVFSYVGVSVPEPTTLATLAIWSLLIRRRR